MSAPSIDTAIRQILLRNGFRPYLIRQGTRLQADDLAIMFHVPTFSLRWSRILPAAVGTPARGTYVRGKNVHLYLMDMAEA